MQTPERIYRLIGADHVEYGPVTAGQLGEWIAQGRANAATLAWTEGAPDWKPLAEMPEFAGVLVSAATIPQIISLKAAGRPQTNGMAIAGLVFGVLSVPLLSCFFVFSILGIIFSCVGLAQINKNGGRETGRGLAITGIVLSCLGLLLAVVVFMLFGALAAVGNNLN